MPERSHPLQIRAISKGTNAQTHESMGTVSDSNHSRDVDYDGCNVTKAEQSIMHIYLRCQVQFELTKKLTPEAGLPFPHSSPHTFVSVSCKAHAWASAATPHPNPQLCDREERELATLWP